MAPKLEAAEVQQKARDAQYEALAWEMLDEMLESALEYGSGHEDALNKIADELRVEYAYKMGELSGQRQSHLTQLENTLRKK
ncbi:hypothetical protein ABBQ32_013745 [Trebouxia sp. C0010 RCD-2024]